MSGRSGWRSVVLRSTRGLWEEFSRPIKVPPLMGSATSSTSPPSLGTLTAHSSKRLLLAFESVYGRQYSALASIGTKGTPQTNGTLILYGGWHLRDHVLSNKLPYQLTKCLGVGAIDQVGVRSFASKVSKQEKQSSSETRKDISTVEDPFDAPTYNIPEKPVTFVEGASYSVIILAGLGVAAAAGYAVFKELIFEPKEYKIFNKALKRIQDDSQVRVRIGSPITGYGQESRNRAARQRIPNKVFTDEDGIEHVQISFHIRGPHGAGKVAAEMFKDKVDKQWKYTYLIVQIVQPSPSQLILESYIPSPATVPA